MNQHSLAGAHRNLIIYVGLFFTVAIASGQGFYPCHPPMEQILVGQQDISLSPIFNNANNWADTFLSNLSAQVHIDALSLSVFGPSGDPIYQNYYGPLKANETEDYGSVEADSIYRVARSVQIAIFKVCLFLSDRSISHEIYTK